MNRDEKYLIRMMFKGKIYSSDAQAFEDLFTKIMTYRYTTFLPVKPQGSFGDMKNDGYIIESGIFYQVYGPENIENSIDDAIKKVKGDFNGLIEKWNHNIEIKEYVYVVNDKYKGARVKVHEKILLLKNELKRLEKEKNILVNLMTAKDLENLFFEIEEDEIIDILGGMPPRTDNINIIDIDFEAVNEVIDHIMNIPAKDYQDDLHVPDFENKIKINGLSQIVRGILINAGFNYGDIELFFENQGEFLREALRDRFKQLYDNSKEEITDDIESYSDKRFFYILEKSMPKRKTLATKFAVECLMAYYFESCDIFEMPPDEEEL